MSSTYRVVPFGNPWIKGYLPLPMAYRSLSRPSSPVRAKASTVRPFLLSIPLIIGSHSITWVIIHDSTSWGRYVLSPFATSWKSFHNVTPVLRFALLFSNMSMISFNYVENFNDWLSFATLTLPILIFSLFSGEFLMIGCRSLRSLCLSLYSHSLVENNGFEPLTPCLQSRCSSQLS